MVGRLLSHTFIHKVGTREKDGVAYTLLIRKKGARDNAGIISK